jgi:hypothetical protein
MNRTVAACLLAISALLPAIDVVYCPDGCGDDARTPCAWQVAAVSSHDDCGICLNGVAISQPPLYLPPVRRHHVVDPFITPSFVSSAPSALERPPRLA